MQVQIQALLAAGGGGTGGVTTGPHVEVAKPAIFSGEAEKVGGICECMQVIHKNEDGRSKGSGTSVLDPVTCARRVSRHMERECHEGIGDRGSQI